MPKGDEKHNFTDKMLKNYSELNEFITKGGRFKMYKREEILKILNEEEKEEYIKLFPNKKKEKDEGIIEEQINEEKINEETANEGIIGLLDKSL